MAMNVEAEIRELKRRVGELEGSFGFLTQQIRSVHKDMLAFQAKMELFQAKMEVFQVDTGKRFEKVEGRLDRVEAGVNGLRKELPRIVVSSMREVLRERKTPRKAP